MPDFATPAGSQSLVSFSSYTIASSTLRLSGSPFNPNWWVLTLAGSKPTTSETHDRANFACERFLPKCDCQNPNNNACGNHSNNATGWSADAANTRSPTPVFS